MVRGQDTISGNNLKIKIIDCDTDIKQTCNYKIEYYNIDTIEYTIEDDLLKFTIKTDMFSVSAEGEYYYLDGAAFYVNK